MNYCNNGVLSPVFSQVSASPSPSAFPLLKVPIVSSVPSRHDKRRDARSQVKSHTFVIFNFSHMRSATRQPSLDFNCFQLLMLTTLTPDIQCEKFIEDASIRQQLQCILISYYLFLYLPNKFPYLWFQE